MVTPVILPAISDVMNTAALAISAIRGSFFSQRHYMAHSEKSLMVMVAVILTGNRRD